MADDKPEGNAKCNAESVAMTIELIRGDCLEVMPTLDDNSVDMILADLPYGTTACKWDTVIPFEPFQARAMTPKTLY